MFVDSTAYAGTADAVLQGAPYDGGVSWRPGAARGPHEIRVASQSIESFSPRTGRDLTDIVLADAGDLSLAGLSSARVMDTIAEATERLARTGPLVVTLGGDHSVSIGTSRGLRAVHPDLVHLIFDAHLDLRPEWEGDEYSHACGTRHMAKAGPTCALGIRSGAREEFADAGALLTGWSEDLRIPAEFLTAMEGRPLFVSVDLDVLDPGAFPGTGNPEPGGVTYRELRGAMLALAGSRVVGIDFVECAAGIDPSGVTAVTAAALVRDVVLGLVPA